MQVKVSPTLNSSSLVNTVHRSDMKSINLPFPVLLLSHCYFPKEKKSLRNVFLFWGKKQQK